MATLSASNLEKGMTTNKPYTKEKSSGENLPVAKITAISISHKKGIPKRNIGKAKLVKGYGIEGDAHTGKWHRQVSLLALESIKKMRAKGLPDLRPGAFAENLTTEFLNLPKLKIGTKLKIGNAELEITQIGKECHTKCAIYNKVGDCVMPREGVFARVTKSGKIEINENITISKR